MAQAVEPLCANCGQALGKVEKLDAADRDLLREIDKDDQELAKGETLQQETGEEHGVSDAPGNNPH